LIDGGFFVALPKCLDLIENDKTVWEQEPLTRLTQMGELMACEHSGFWQPLDTLRDKNYLKELWAFGQASWKKW
jgi:glucose-1-phosphate cytidylyltransferase